MQDGTSACVLVVSVVSVVSADSGDSVADGPVAVLRTQGDRAGVPVDSYRPSAFCRRLRCGVRCGIAAGIDVVDVRRGIFVCRAGCDSSGKPSAVPRLRLMRGKDAPAGSSGGRRKGVGAGGRVVSFDRSLGLRRSGRSFSLSGPFCPFDLLEPVVRTVSSDRNRSGVFVGRDGVFARLVRYVFVRSG